MDHGSSCEAGDSRRTADEAPQRKCEKVIALTLSPLNSASELSEHIFGKTLPMKRLLTVLAVMTIVVPIPAIAADVGVSVQVGEPGFYGRIDIGTFPQPQVIYPQPVVIQAVPAGVVRSPIYLHVPPGHAKHWRKHCREYNACGQPVYFVQDRWYDEVYVPRYRESRGRGHGEHHGENNGKGNGHGHGKGHRDD